MLYPRFKILQRVRFKEFIGGEIDALPKDSIDIIFTIKKILPSRLYRYEYHVQYYINGYIEEMSFYEDELKPLVSKSHLPSWW